jgi:pumilio family protein 6
MITAHKNNILRFLHTKPGAKAAVLCISYATAKLRKAIIKGCKTFIIKICREQYGHIVILAYLRYVDDTVILTNQILKPMLNSYKELIFDKYGARCLLALLIGLSKKFLSPETLALLNTVMVPDPEDNTKQVATSKKDFDVKSKEFETTTIASLSSQITEPEVLQMLNDKFGSVVLYD